MFKPIFLPESNGWSVVTCNNFRAVAVGSTPTAPSLPPAIDAAGAAAAAAAAVTCPAEKGMASMSLRPTFPTPASPLMEPIAGFVTSPPIVEAMLIDDAAADVDEDVDGEWVAAAAATDAASLAEGVERM